MNLWDFLHLLIENGLGFYAATILIICGMFVFSFIMIPFRVGKIKTDVEQIKKLLKEAHKGSET